MRVRVKTWLESYREQNAIQPRPWYANLERRNDNKIAPVEQRKGKLMYEKQTLRQLAKYHSKEAAFQEVTIKRESSNFGNQDKENNKPAQDECRQNSYQDTGDDGGTNSDIKTEDGENAEPQFEPMQCIPVGMHQLVDDLIACRTFIEFPDCNPSTSKQCPKHSYMKENNGSLNSK